MYILKVLLNLVTAGTEVNITLENEFLFSCVEEICCL